MKIVALIVATSLLLGCATQKATENPAKTTDSGIVMIPVERMNTDSIPACIGKLITSFSAAAIGNPPRKIWSYTYQNRTVYYVQPECCDNFSDLYDDNCILLGHPDGGFTGRGDGGFPDFIKERTNEKLVWQDKRK